MSAEHKLQNAARNALAGECMLFRGNVGTGWQGKGKPEVARKTYTTVLQPGDVVLRQARPFSTGLPEGFADTFGIAERVITADMVGLKIGVFFAIEFKDEGKNPTTVQKNFIAAVNRAGGFAFVARSVDDARAVVKMAKGGK